MRGKILLVVLVVVVIMFSGCIQQPENPLAKRMGYDSDMSKECESKEGSQQVLCYKIQAVEKLDKTICYKISAGFERDTCLHAVAQETLNPDPCGEMTSFAEGRNLCFSYIAGMKANSSICERITEDYDKKVHCIAGAKRDSSICESLSGEKKQDCISNVEWLKGNK